MGSLDFSSVPLSALRHLTRNSLSQQLNGPKVLPSPSNLPRDFRGIAHIAGVNCPHVGYLDPTTAVLTAWEKRSPTVQQLLDALKEIDRWDVFDDTIGLIEKDVEEFRKNTTCTRHQETHQNSEDDTEILTVDDVQCIETCGKPQCYDAFLLFDDSDQEFALTMLSKLENEYGLKLCTKDRDLIGGLPFEHVAIMQLIRDRCRRLIVIVSPAFMDSPANKFFVSYAQAVGVEQQQRKIIPCVYLKFPRPPQLSFYFVLDFTRASQLWDLWDRLSQSLKAASPRPSISNPERRAIMPAKSSVDSQPAKKECKVSEYKPLARDNWDCSKKHPIPKLQVEDVSVQEHQGFDVPSTTDLISFDSESIIDSAPVIYNVESPSESFSELNNTEPINLNNSKASSTTSLLSKVFSQAKIPKPKSWFKRKKKTAIAIST